MPTITGRGTGQGTGSATNKPRKAKQRSNKPSWPVTLDPLDFGEEEFRLTVLFGKGRQKLVIDEYVESLTWAEDDKHVMTGSITVRAPLIPGTYKLRPGMEVRCDVRKKEVGHWRELWRMRLTEPEFQAAAGEYTFQLADDLVRLGQSKDNFIFKKGKHHPNGWLAHEAIHEICRRYGVKVHHLPKMKHRITKMSDMNVSPLSEIQKILKFERVDTGRKYFVKWVNGGISVIPFKRSRELLLIKDAIIDGTVKETLGANFATSLVVTATGDKTTKKDAKGNKKPNKHKVSVTVQTKKGIDTYGLIRRTITAPKGVSKTELHKWGLRQLTKVAKPKREVTITHMGLARVSRGAALRISIPEASIKNQVVYVSGVTHNVTPGAYTMDVTVQFDDPYIDKHKESDHKKRCEKARKHNRKAPKGCAKVKKSKNTTKKSKQRSGKK